MNKIYAVSILGLSLLSAGCGTSENNSGTTGSLSLNITDAPIDTANSVVVQFSAVQIRGTEASQNIDFNFDTPKSIDLLLLQGSESESLFTNETVPAGTYDEVRLIVDAEDGTQDSFIVLTEGGQQHDLSVPSGSQSGLKIKGSFVVPANGSASFTADFDVRKSIVKSGNPDNPKYHLKPVIRIVDNAEVGHIQGTVDTALLTDPGCSDADADTYNAVYVFEGSAITPDDIDGDTIEPVVASLLKYDSLSDTYSYEAGFLLAGEYTLSFTCNSDLEDIQTNDDLKFQGTQSATVITGEPTSVNF